MLKNKDLSGAQEGKDEGGRMNGAALKSFVSLIVFPGIFSGGFCYLDTH